MEVSPKQIDEEGDRAYRRQVETAKKRSAADKTFFSAAASARQSVKADDLWPRRNADGLLRYTVQQGLRAAC